MDERVAEIGIAAPAGVTVTEFSRILAPGTVPVKLDSARDKFRRAHQREYRRAVIENNQGGLETWMHGDVLDYTSTVCEKGPVYVDFTVLLPVAGSRLGFEPEPWSS